MSGFPLSEGIRHLNRVNHGLCKINPRVDFAFKKLFGSEENKDLLISLVNAVVSEEEQEVEFELNIKLQPRLTKPEKFSAWTSRPRPPMCCLQWGDADQRRLQL